MTAPSSCICSFPWAGTCKSCSERTARFAATFFNGFCSSECTEECSARDHCNLVNDPHCTCKSCAAHNLDELPPKETDE